MKDPFSEIIDTYELLQEMEKTFLASPTPSALLGKLTASDKAVFARAYLDNLDDMITASIFAAFESRLREHVLLQLSGGSGTSAGLSDWLESAVERARVSDLLDACSGTLSQAQKKRVDNIRKFRNWVAHGRQGPLPPKVKPETPLGVRLALQSALKAVGAL